MSATLALAAATIIVAFVPALQRALVLDRDAVGAGQLWRVATGNIVHFSASHLLLDLLAVTVAGLLLERRGWSLGAILVAASIAIGTAVLAFAPELARYGGLSGIAFTLVVLYALDCLTERGPMRMVAVLALALTAAKVGWELSSGAFVFVGGAGDAFQPVPLVHLVGAGAGVAAFLLSPARHRSRSPSARRREQQGLEVEAEVGQR
jgi:rhomboid family GlyGly-CTERM serine protease